MRLGTASDSDHLPRRGFAPLPLYTARLPTYRRTDPCHRDLVPPSSWVCCRFLKKNAHCGAGDRPLRSVLPLSILSHYHQTFRCACLSAYLTDLVLPLRVCLPLILPAVCAGEHYYPAGDRPMGPNRPLSPCIPTCAERANRHLPALPTCPAHFPRRCTRTLYHHISTFLDVTAARRTTNATPYSRWRAYPVVWPPT